MRHFFFLWYALLTFTAVNAQNTFKFGECPKELAAQSSYPDDADAPAFVVYESKCVYFKPSLGVLEQVRDYVVRIKILNQDGVNKYSEASVVYYEASDRREKVSGLTGFTYNIENNKVVKEKLSKDYIFKEDINDRVKRMKFALPSVKVGSVIEYKYSLSSPFFYNIGDFVFQWDIPVQYGKHEIRIPSYFSLNKEMKGFEVINVSSRKANDTMWGSVEEFTANVNNLPALKDESYVWNYNDFRSRVSFELRSIQIPGRPSQDYTVTWANAAERMRDDDNFGKQLKNKGILKEDLPGTLAGKTSAEDSIRAILNLVRSKIKWNNGTTMWISSMSKALKDGVGSSADINAVLLNALRNAGFNAFPVVMSLRSNGRIPMSYPSIESFNYFVVGVFVENKTYYLDGTRSYTDLNVLPIECLVENALTISDFGFDRVNLSEISGSANRVILQLSFNENGFLKGTVYDNYVGEFAYQFKSAYDRANNETGFVGDLETKNAIAISDYKMEERVIAQSLGYLERYNFEKKDVQLDGHTISFNPLSFCAMKENVFKSETRKLPVEFPYLMEQLINVSIIIPKGYIVDGLPKSERFLFGEKNEIEASYLVQQEKTTIHISYRTKIGMPIVPVTDYSDLRDLWSKLYNKENEMITLKKVDE
ncbi:MAG: DUF3857 domain-containing protein [Dysgonamonadaceae bacterium]|jgi:hypothetical protein|nr:DUF3857 domain-containing protein [Dysgonamonadaceae bacterium]